MKVTKSIAVVYENPDARQPAVTFCDGLVKRFWDQFDFDISWRQLDALEENDSAGETMRKATQADFVIISARFGPGIPRALKHWVETWLRQRGEHEGVLVGLPSPQATPGFETSATSLYLRSVAHRACMDYLTEVPQGISHPLPESLESCTERAQQVTSLLNEILRSPPPATLPLF
jgi:hypothetical protein